MGHAFSGAPSLTSSAAKGSPVGKYTIFAATGTLQSKNYAFIFETGSLYIAKAHLTVTPNSSTVTYGAGLPAFTYVVTGYVNGDTAASAFTGAPALSTTAGKSAGVGTYAIDSAAGTLNSSNYAFEFATGTLTIRKATLTVAANQTIRSYGASTPALSYVITGFAYHDTVGTATTGTAVLSTTATLTSGVGTYSISASQGTLSAVNYSFRFSGSTLIIVKAQVTVTAQNQAIVYGSTIPVLTYSFSGLVNGETPQGVFRGTPTLTTTAKVTSSVGSYPITITAGSLAATNYAFTFVPGTLKINKGVLTVMAVNQTITAGTPIPVLSYSLSGFAGDESLGNALTGEPSLTTTATANSPAGSYPITVGLGSLAAQNYSFQLLNGTLVITPASTSGKH